jgi:hypothetical protein
MAFVGLDEKKRKVIEAEKRNKMEVLSKRLTDLILSQPPQDLLGYIWGQLLMGSMFASADGPDDEGDQPNKSTSRAGRDQLNSIQFVLEYVHAALAGYEEDEVTELSEPVCAEIIKVADELRSTTLSYCMISSAAAEDGPFGPKTGEIEFLAKSNWVMMRGNRYQVLEKEFFAFVLMPHNDILEEVYGVGADDIAIGIQAVADSMRTGHMRAADEIEKQMDAAHAFTIEQGGDVEQAAAIWRKTHPERVAASMNAFTDLFRGEICNVSKHTKLPHRVLEDLAYVRGSNVDFYAPGPLAGTPLRTLPARIKPLIKLDESYFATDPAFVRDSAYRSLLWKFA